MKAVKTNRYLNPDKAKKRLIFWLLVFFIGISLPVYFLLDKVYSQLENETWYNQRNQAELLVERIERQLLEKLQPEQDRPIAEYSFFNVLENPLLQSATVNFSPLSAIPPKSDIPGLIGYFQVDPDGSFHIPALPEFNAQLDDNLQSGLSPDALATRIELKEKLRGLLTMAEPESKPEQDQDGLKTDKVETNELEESKARSYKPLPKSKRLDEYFQSDTQDSASDSGSSLTKKQADKTLSPAASSPKSPVLSDDKLSQLNINPGLWKEKRKPNEAKNYELKQSKDIYRQQARKETVKIPDQSLASAVLNRNRSPAASDLGLAKSKSERAQPASSVGHNEPEPKKSGQIAVEEQPSINILSFESEVSPLQLITLGNRYLCFYRNAWNGKSRYIQGLIVDEHFLQGLVQPILDTTDGIPLSSVLIVDKGNLLQQFKITAAGSELLLFRRSLLSPFQQMEIIVNSSALSSDPGKQVLDLVSVALAFIIPVGFILFYRLSAGQIELAKQQRNFISSISHELKTPLTSIRMYSEMLRSDWVADETRKKSYYDYIYFESERLSRLIANVLQLARFDNHKEKTQLVSVNAKALLQQVQNKVAAQIEAANYQLNLIPPGQEPTDAELKIDEDAFFQIMINLVDNAIKFTKQSENKAIDIGYKISGKQRELVFYVRDYGPGVEKEQMKKIFRLFYRAGDELTRTQPGTGIGLALVVQLAQSMGAVVDLINRSPGAEFQVKFGINSR